MSTDPAAKQTVFSSLPFKISKNKFQYSGIWIMHNFKHLYKANFLPLVKSMRHYLERWNLLALSLGGRINTIRMNVLSRLSVLMYPYLFDEILFCLLINIYLHSAGIKKTLWIQKTMLQWHREYGGLSLPNFQYYYWSANIRAMLHWLNPAQVSAQNGYN